ncbi:MAG: hypothetical protein ACFFC7_11360 [Candidatus Hermodarchaeota archaeon]
MAQQKKLENYLEAIEKRMTEFKESIDTLRSEWEGRIRNLEEKVDNQTASMSKLEETFSNLIEKQIQQALADTSLIDQMQEIEAAISKMGLIADRVTTVSEKIGTVSDKITTVSDKVGTLPDKIATVSDRISNVSDRIDTVSDKISTFPDRISALPGKMRQILDPVAEDMKNGMASISGLVEKMFLETLPSLKDDFADLYKSEQEVVISNLKDHIELVMAAVKNNVEQSEEKLMLSLATLNNWMETFLGDKINGLTHLLQDNMNVIATTLLEADKQQTARDELIKKGFTQIQSNFLTKNDFKNSFEMLISDIQQATSVLPNIVAFEDTVSETVEPLKENLQTAFTQLKEKIEFIEGRTRATITDKELQSVKGDLLMQINTISRDMIGPMEEFYHQVEKALKGSSNTLNQQVGTQMETLSGNVQTLSRSILERVNSLQQSVNQQLEPLTDSRKHLEELFKPTLEALVNIKEGIKSLEGQLKKLN